MANVPPSSSSVPQTSYELAERVQISMAGFLFNKIRVRQLCIEAFKIPPEIVDREGPLTVATVYLDRYACLDSPSFISFSYYRKETPTIVRRGHVLVCRLAYVSPGLAVPALPFDGRTQAYIERWFPQAIRSTVPFEGIQYLQVPYPSNRFRELNHLITVCLRFECSRVL